MAEINKSLFWSRYSNFVHGKIILTVQKAIRMMHCYLLMILVY